jgi:hypothetical protein
MRKQLASVEGSRKKFTATFSRFGRKTNYHGYVDRTVLLTNIIDVETNAVVTDHVWFNYTKAFEELTLEHGVKVAFDARVKIYKKGYVNRKYKIDHGTVDFKLSHPTKLRLLEL